MKRIFAILLVLALCIPVMFSCGQDKVTNTTLDEYAEMYKNSKPTKVVTVTSQSFYYLTDSGNEEELDTLTSTYSIINGTIDGDKVSKYTSDVESFRTVEDGGKDELRRAVTVIEHTIIEAIEGVGSRTTSSVDDEKATVGSWNEEGTVIEIEKGAMAINLDESLISDIKEEEKQISFTVLNKNIAGIFGADVAAETDGDAYVVITTDGAVITSITVRYSVPANEELNVSRSEMVITISYSYDLEIITIE